MFETSNLSKLHQSSVLRDLHFVKEYLFVKKKKEESFIKNCRCVKNVLDVNLYIHIIIVKFERDQ